MVSAVSNSSLSSKIGGEVGVEVGVAGGGAVVDRVGLEPVVCDLSSAMDASIA